MRKPRQKNAARLLPLLHSLCANPAHTLCDFGWKLDSRPKTGRGMAAAGWNCRTAGRPWIVNTHPELKAENEKQRAKWGAELNVLFHAVSSSLPAFVRHASAKESPPEMVPGGDW
jgi:hypothetical protein